VRHLRRDHTGGPQWREPNRWKIVYKHSHSYLCSRSASGVKRYRLDFSGDRAREDGRVQALIDNLVERGLDPTVRRPFIIDGAEALSKAIRRTFGRDAAIQRCQIHKARNILERLPKSMHASVRRVLRQAWEMDYAEKAETLIRNLARRLERDWNGVAASILEGIDEMLTVTRLGPLDQHAAPERGESFLETRRAIGSGVFRPRLTRSSRTAR
jgi:hypothetical protein